MSMLTSADSAAPPKVPSDSHSATSPDRLGALAGAAYVALSIVAAVVTGAAPATNAPRAEIAGYYVDHAAGIEAGLWLFGFGSVALMWWFGSLWRRMAELEDGAPRLAVVSLVGLAVAGTLGFVSSAVSATLALRGSGIGDVAPIAHTLAVVLLTATGFALTAHLVATNVLALGVAPRWLVMVGFASAVVFLFAGILGAATDGGMASGASLVAFVLWLVWVAGVSRWMWKAA